MKFYCIKVKGSPIRALMLFNLNMCNIGTVRCAPVFLIREDVDRFLGQMNMGDAPYEIGEIDLDNCRGTEKSVSINTKTGEIKQLGEDVVNHSGMALIFYREGHKNFFVAPLEKVLQAVVQN